MSAAFAEEFVRYQNYHKIIASVAGLVAGAVQSFVTWPSRRPEREIMSFLEASAPDYLPLPQMRELQFARLRAVAARAYRARRASSASAWTSAVCGPESLCDPPI